MRRRELTNGEADAVFDILVRVAGAREHQRPEFTSYLTRPNGVGHWEFRFGGHLGAGGKLYYDGERLRVGCYREDDNEMRGDVIARANAELALVRDA